MANISAFTCLVSGLKALRPKIGLVVALALLLISVSALPIFIDRFQGNEYSAPPISLWGFFMNVVSWTSETLILVAVSQMVWLSEEGGGRTSAPVARRAVAPAIFLWSLSFAVTVFVLHMGVQFWLQSVARSSQFLPLPILPLFFYFFAFVPLLIVERQVGVWVAIKQVYFSAKTNLFSMLKLALTAEVIFLTISVLVIMLQHEIMNSYAISKSVFADQAITVIYAAAIGIINSAMMAVAFAEIHGLSQESQQLGEPKIAEHC